MRAFSRSPGRGPRQRTGVNAIPLGRSTGESRNDEPVDDEEETQVRLWVLHSDCAKIIGRQGRTLREIEARCRCRVKVSKEELMDKETKERAVDIMGSSREQNAAIDMVLELSQYCRDDGGEVLKDNRGPRDTVPKEAREDLGEAGPEEKRRVIEVLPEEVGRLLGRKGETVKIVEKDSGCKIEIDK
ncbi:unnamed protein product, partial [Polarella glacialis]